MGTNPVVKRWLTYFSEVRNIKTRLVSVEEQVSGPNVGPRSIQVLLLCHLCTFVRISGFFFSLRCYWFSFSSSLHALVWALGDQVLMVYVAVDQYSTSLDLRNPKKSQVEAGPIFPACCRRRLFASFFFTDRGRALFPTITYSFSSHSPWEQDSSLLIIEPLFLLQSSSICCSLLSSGIFFF